jgi:hypothetical protein
MLLSRHVFLASIFAVAILLLDVPASAETDQAAAARILGPHWKQLSRRAGMVFAGTVLTNTAQTVRTDCSVPSVEVSLRVDHAIIGVQPGQVLTIHEWAGALSRHPAMRRGEHLLLFLYPPSSLGLTSPVGGSQGQLRLDSLGTTVFGKDPIPQPDSQTRSQSNSPRSTLTSPNHPVATLGQLEHAVRAARGE